MTVEYESIGLMKVLQINTAVSKGSTGNIANDIGNIVMGNGHESAIGYKSIGIKGSESRLYPIGSRYDEVLHGLKTRIFDLHGFASEKATIDFIDRINEFNPDIVHLHNVHGYYINIEILFSNLKKKGLPVIWTFHDCWPFTGHCTYFDSIGCERWKTGCYSCPKKKMYPASYVIDNSKKNYINKKQIFNNVENLTIVTPSKWLSELVGESFLKNYRTVVIHNGIDLDTFSVKPGNLPPGFDMSGKKMILGVANTWDERKGLRDFIRLSKIISDDYRIVLVGLNKKQISTLPQNITGLTRTENAQQLAALYYAADVFVNPTWQDNFPTTNLEALACGTPVITYETGGSPEAIDKKTGWIIPKGDIEGLWQATIQCSARNRSEMQILCRERAEKMFDKNDRYIDYLKLYENILNN